MTVEATVLIPTHNHGHLLGYSVRSALEQSVSDIEVFIVGDGMDDTTRAEALEMARSDRRVKVFDNPKGPRHGEAHRHEPLQEASGRVVCYLSDDDLFLPEHVATMLELLDSADFAVAIPLGVRTDGSIVSWVGHPDVDISRERIARFENFIPLTCGSHTMELYRRLPHGWRTTPGDIGTDVYMWAQILEKTDMRSVAAGRLTVLHFPSPWRSDWSLEQRVEELALWHTRMADPGFEIEITAELVGHLLHHRTMLDRHSLELGERAEALEEMVHTGRDAFLTLETHLKETIDELTLTQEKLAKLDERRVELEAALAWSRVEHDQTRAELGAALERARVEHDRTREELAHAFAERESQRNALEDARDRADQLRRERDMMLGSLTWRVRNRLLRMPGLAPLARWVGRARSRRGGT